MPTCDRRDCERDSDYLLTVGDRCREHAIEDQPATVGYLDWATPVGDDDQPSR